MRKLVALITALMAATACASTISGNGTVGSDLLNPSSPAPDSSATVPSSSPPPPAHLSGPLTDKLVDPPTGARPWDSGWARNRTPTVRQFVAHDYPRPYVDHEVNLLKAQGLRRVAHETWYAPDADQADMVLLEFDSTRGARARYLNATFAKKFSPGIKHFAVPGSPRGNAYYHPQLDKLGNVLAIVYGRVENIVVEEFYFSPARIRKADAITWMQGQLAALT